jgi:putative transposase
MVFRDTLHKGRKPLFSKSISTKYGYGDYVGATPCVAQIRMKRTNVIKEVMNEMEDSYQNLHFDFYCVMPTHFHVIIVFDDKITKKTGETRSRPYEINNNVSLVGATPPPRLVGEAGCVAYKEASLCLGDIVGAIKAITSKRLEESFWQRGFYEHIIRSEFSLDRIRNYILRNPQSRVQDWSKIDPRPI